MASLTVKINNRLTKEISNLKNSKYFIFENTNDPLIWNIYFKNFDKDSCIYNELKNKNIDKVKFEIRFPIKYPFKPPFLRIVEPRFIGYEGFITSGGSLCVNLLTPNGWSPVYTINKLLLQIKVFIKDGKLSKDYKKPYTYDEALYHFNHTTKLHNWG